MPRFVRRSPMPVSAEALFDWHARPGAFERLTPPWQPVRLERHEGIGEGDRAVIRLGPGPLALRWVAEHHDVVPGRQFVDTQVEGPFAAWTHTHRMIPEPAPAEAGGPGRSFLEDDVQYALPLAPLTQPLGGGVALGQFGRLFAYRHRVTQTDLARHAAAALDPMTVAVTGASGLVGGALAAFLSTGGHRVVRLVRSREAAAAPDTVYWNVARGEVDEPALAAAAPDVVLHLAGEPVYAPRWTVAKKRRIWESRTKGTRLLSRALARLDRPPRLLLSASASGFYGDRGAAPLDESAPPGEGFLAAVTQAWEASTDAAEAAGIRTVHLRIGVVLTPAGGALALALPAFRLGLGGPVGYGDGFLPWIALDDLLYAILHLLGTDLRGPVNLSAPTPVTTRAFARTLGDVLHRPTPLAAPAPLLRFAGGEMARETILMSTRMLPARIRSDGFTFAYPTLDAALRHVLGAAPPPP